MERSVTYKEDYLIMIKSKG